jgi:hypothetical protein
MSDNTGWSCWQFSELFFCWRVVILKTQASFYIESCVAGGPADHPRQKVITASYVWTSCLYYADKIGASCRQSILILVVYYYFFPANSSNQDFAKFSQNFSSIVVCGPVCAPCYVYLEIMFWKFIYKKMKPDPDISTDIFQVYRHMFLLFEATSPGIDDKIVCHP